MAKRTKRPAKPAPRQRPASTDAAWTAGKHAEIAAREAKGEAVTFAYLLTDDMGLPLIAQGILPQDIIDQARRSCEWLMISLPPMAEKVPA